MAVLAVAAAMATPNALAAPPPVGPVTVDQTMSQQLLAKASPDECYNPLAPAAEYVAMPDSGVCPAGLIPKTNDAYVWGQTHVDNDIWFGTAPNYICLVMADMAGMTGSLPPSFATKDLTCQFGDSPYLTGNKYPTQLDAASGDWRPPHIYRYDTALGKLVDKTPTSGTGLELINVTEGLRSAGSIGHIAFLAGPVIAQEKSGVAYKGVNVFAYDNLTGHLLAAKNFPEYSNVRQWLTIGHSIYVGMMGTDTGKILRWTGWKTPLSDFLSFETVGTLPAGAGGPAEMTYSPVDGHIYATTWNLAMGGSGVYRSPTGHLDNGTFTAEAGDATDSYQQIWSPGSYEPDLALSAGYLGGAIQAYDGYVYWGVIHVPAMNLLLHQARLQRLGIEATTAQLAEAAVKSLRTTTLWRIKVSPDAVPTEAAALSTDGGDIQLLYGESQLPKYNAADSTWSMASTNWTPKLGHSGFGNPFNTYTWSMEQFNGKLFVGTFDWSYLLYGAARDLGPSAASSLGLDPDMVSAIVTKFGEGAQSSFGADLARFDSADTDGQPTPAAFEDINGVGNYLNYGVRTMSTDDNNLYIGSANPANLNENGGWELIQLTKGTAPAFPASTPPDGRVGDAYSYTYTATGDPAPRFSLEDGALPPGMTLTHAGVLAGTPTAAGDYTFRVAARNGVAPAAVVDSAITVAPAYVPPPSPPYIPPVVPTSPSPSPSPTSASPTPTATQAGGLACTTPTALKVLDPTIVAGRAARVQLKGTPGDKVQILGYSRPSTQYRVLRPSVTIPASGVVDYLFLPSTNTRMYAASATCANSGSTVINVAPRFSSLSAVRVGPMHYRFSGLLAPAAPNAGRVVRLVSPGYGALPSSAVSTVRVGGSTLRPGTFSFDLTLTKPGRFTFLATTAGNLVNVAGASSGRLTSIH